MHKSFFPKTRGTRDVDTVTFFPKQIVFPTINLDVFLRQAAADIINLLTNPLSATTLSLQAGDATKNALSQLAAVLKRADNLPQAATEPAVLPSTQTPTIVDDAASPRVPLIVDELPKHSHDDVFSPRVRDKPAPHLKSKPTLPHRYPLRSTN